MGNEKWLNKSDLVFTILLLILFVGCIVMFFVTTIINQPINTGGCFFSVSGVGTSASLYMKWRKPNESKNNNSLNN